MMLTKTLPGFLRAPLLLIGAGALGLALLATPAHSQEEGELHSVQRDQNRIGLRLVSLREKMDRLIDRYEAEGRERNAELLRTAVEQFDLTDLLERSREIDRGLESGMLSTVGDQDTLVTALESIYSVLRDRRDVDEMREQADLLGDGIAELDRLGKEQKRLFEETSARSDTPAAVMDEALAEGERLQRSLAESSEAQATLKTTEAALGEVALADFLAEQQRALANDPGTTAGDERRLASGVAQLLSGLSEPLDGSADSELLQAAQSQRERARDAVAQALEAMERASAALEAQAQTADGEAPTGSEESSAQGRGPESTGAESGVSDGSATETSGADASAAETSAGEPSGAETSGAESSGDEGPGAGSSGDGGSGAESSGEAGQGTEAGGAEPSDDGGDGAESGDARAEASGLGAEAGASGAAAQGDEPSERQEVGQEDPPGADEATAKESMDEASERLEQARDALVESERTLAAARNRARAMAAASARQAESQAEELKQDAQRLEAAEPEAGPELLDRTRELMAELAAMQEALQSQQLAQAGQQGTAAEQSLNEILEQLRQRRQGADDQVAEPATPEQVAAAVADQQELKRRLRELMDRLEELPDQEFQQPGQRAESAMESASEALDEGRSQEAATRQEEASEALDEAKKKLQGERDRYEQLRQEEVLFKLGEELKEMLDEQIAASSETREIDEARGDRERLSRSHRRAVARLSESERTLSREATSLAEDLAADGAKVFVFAIEQIADGLESAANELADQQTGAFVASIQQSVEHRLADLSAVLADELERRRKAMSEMDADTPPGEQGGDSKQPLVPPVAELLLIQRMELMALTRIENFQSLHGAEGMGEMELLVLERWALEHSKTTALFETMIPKEPEVAVEGEADGSPTEHPTEEEER